MNPLGSAGKGFAQAMEQLPALFRGSGALRTTPAQIETSKRPLQLRSLIELVGSLEVPLGHTGPGRCCRAAILLGGVMRGNRSQPNGNYPATASAGGSQFLMQINVKEFSFAY